MATKKKAAARMSPRSSARKNLRVMTTIELNVINAAKSVVATDGDTTASAQRYVRAYDRLVRAVFALNTAEERDRLKRDRLRKSRSRTGTRPAMK